MSLNILTRFGQRVRQLRERAGFSQEDFAHEAGVDRSHYGAIERGEANVRLVTVELIAKGLKVPPLELFRFGKRKQKK